jgi:hypothetical protein
MTGQRKGTDQTSSSENLGPSLVKSIFSSELVEIIADIAELPLDSVLAEGALKEVPVLGLLVKGYGVATTIRDLVFLKKVQKFLYGTGSFTEGEKSEFREKIDSDPDFCRKVGENLVLLLDRHDNFDKAYILGKVFAGCIRGEIQYDTFLKLAAAIDRTFIGDLKGLESYYSRIESYDSKLGKPFSEFLEDATCQSLYNAGLVRSEGYTENTYHPNELGSTLIRLLRETGP